MKNELFMKRCIELAKMAIGQTYPNPLVGSIIVHNGKIIGEGYHHKAGEVHAEINAINSVKDASLLPFSDIYVSLEPCAHFGKTPPCALKIKEIGFKKVFIGALDPHEKVNGQGKKIIEEAGIEVTDGVLEKECRELNKRFFTFHQKKRPYILLKWAQSEDGFLDANFKPVPIGNPLTQQFVHVLRNQEHAILVGTQTALNDNPSLTTRAVAGRNPTRILIDFDLKVPSSYQIFNKDAQTIIFNGMKNQIENHLHFIKIEKENSMQQLLTKLYEHQIQSVLVEGGRSTLQQFIDAGIWDEAIIIKNPNLRLEKGTKTPEFNGENGKSTQFRDNEVVFYENKC